MLGVFFLEERNFLSDLYNQKLVWLGPNPSSCCDPGRSSFIRENGHSGCLFAHHQAQLRNFMSVLLISKVKLFVLITP